MITRVGVVVLASMLALQLSACKESTDDAGALAQLLDEFLVGASAGSAAAHERFWADDLVYTSSNGTRTNKQAILDQIRAASEDASGSSEVPAAQVIYSAEDVDIRIYGNTAIIAFLLVGTNTDDPSDPLRYFNTGTFLKRDGRWQAVAWQATKIPDDTEAD